MRMSRRSRCSSSSSDRTIDEDKTLARRLDGVANFAKEKRADTMSSIFVIKIRNNINAQKKILLLKLLLALLTQLASSVSVQRLNVPDLVVIDQMHQSRAGQMQQRIAPAQNAHQQQQEATKQVLVGQQPEAASLIINDQLANNNQITFECLVSFDKRKDRNLIIKWHHDERNEPIYQWIPELNKRSIAPQYRPFIVPIPAGGNLSTTIHPGQQLNSTSTLEAGFKLVKPTKELGGKYTCSAISSQNDDSKSKKMIVYTPPRSFKFTATRTDLGLLLASQRDRLIQSAILAPQVSVAQQLPLAYRMRTGLTPAQANNGDLQPISLSTISPQLFSTIDYVNVNQRSFDATAAAARPISSADRQRTPTPVPSTRPHPGLKLVCDIEQVFPVPEVSIYRLAKLDGSHPERLAKLDTKIERDLSSGLFRVQVTSILDDEQLLTKSRATRQFQATGNEPIYFECLMALTNLELSKYADNKRSIAYKPTWMASSGAQTSGDGLELDQTAAANGTPMLRPADCLLLLILAFFILIMHQNTT